MPDEVEGKLILTSAARHEDIEAIAALPSIAGFTVAHRSEHSLSDAYFDTPERDLARVKLALRIRGEDGRDRLTLKGDASIDAGVVSRSELELEWSVGALDEVLRAIANAGVMLNTSRLDTAHGATAALTSLGLEQTAPRTNQRTVLEIADASGAVLADLDVDRVVFTAGRTKVLHYEVECEAHGDGGSDAIRAVLGDLTSRFEGLQPVTYSKLALAEHLEHLEATGQLPGMMGGDGLRPGAYQEIETTLEAL